MRRRRQQARRMMRRVVAVVALLALVVPPVASAACPRTSLAAVEDTVMCQVCGVPLGLATESPEATRERAFISTLVARCDTASQIRTALVAQYGSSVLAAPLAAVAERRALRHPDQIAVLNWKYCGSSESQSNTIASPIRTTSPPPTIETARPCRTSGRSRAGARS